MTGDLDPRLVAAFGLLGRVGASNVQLRYSDDEEPTVWMAVASFERDGQVVHEATGALDPTFAVMRLCAQLIDGGECQHCHRFTGFEADHTIPTDTPLDRVMEICWYQWDPELATFRRGCEGDES